MLNTRQMYGTILIDILLYFPSIIVNSFFIGRKEIILDLYQTILHNIIILNLMVHYETFIFIVNTLILKLCN